MMECPTDGCDNLLLMRKRIRLITFVQLVGSFCEEFLEEKRLEA